MKSITKVALAAMAFTTVANADIYVHGRDPNHTRTLGLNANAGYWMDGTTNLATANTNGTKQFFNWDGRNRFLVTTPTSTSATGNEGVRNSGTSSNSIMQSFASAVATNAGTGMTVLRCHSAGCLMAAKYIWLYGSAKVQRVVAGASAEGGSELASMQQPEPLTYDLQIQNARGFTHNITIMTYHGGGSRCEPFGSGSWGNIFGCSIIAPNVWGEDDGAVGYHSSLGVAQYQDGSTLITYNAKNQKGMDICDNNDWTGFGTGCNGRVVDIGASTSTKPYRHWSGHAIGSVISGFDNNNSGKAAQYLGHSAARRYAAGAW